MVLVQKMSFTIFQSGKTPFQGIKTRSSKDRKIDIFPKGLTHGFGPNMAIFLTFFQAIQARKMSFTILQSRKNAFLGYQNKKFKRSKNVHFSNGVNLWFWSKNGHFSNFFFFGNIGQENVFYDMLERKNAFLGYKNKKFKKLKNGHFFKVVNPWFWSKNGHFSNFLFLGNIGQENVFYDILELKNGFRGYKNRKVKKSKN